MLLFTVVIVIVVIYRNLSLVQLASVPLKTCK